MTKYLISLVIISLLALWPFFKKGYFESHDGEWMVIRFSAFHQTLAAGQFPVRFVDRLNNNYGYPVLNFLYPLPFYLAEIPKMLGFGFVDSVKIIFIFSSVSSVLAMFWALLLIFPKSASFAAAILYLFIPYRFVDLYVRGSLGESLAFLFLPLILGSIIKISQAQKLYLPILSISVTLLILSHNVIAALFIPIFLIASFVLTKKFQILTIAAFFLGIGGAAFFALPALYDLHFVKLSQISVSNIKDHLVNFSQLVMPIWGYGPTPQGSNPLPTQLGIVSIAMFIASLYLLINKKNKNPLITFLVVLYIFIGFLMLKISLPIWQSVPYLDVIQFPWRLLSIIAFTTSLLCAYTLSTFNSKTIPVAVVVIASVISTIIYTKPAIFTDKGDFYYSTNEDSTTVRDEYLPLWVEEKPTSRANEKIVINTNDGEIKSQNIRPTKYEAQIDLKVPSTVFVNSIYFPTWSVKSDGRQVPVAYDNKYGLINFQLPPGQHEVIINYTRTRLHLISEIISLLALGVTGAFFIYQWRKQNS